VSDLRRVFEALQPFRGSVLEAAARAAASAAPGREGEASALARASVERVFECAARGVLDAFVADEASAAIGAAREGRPAQLQALAIQVLSRAALPFLLQAQAPPDALAESLLALDELSSRRLTALLLAQEKELARRLAEAEDQASRAEERALELKRANDSLRRSEARSQHRAEQIALLSSVVHRIAGILDPERLMEETARMIQARMGHSYVAVVVLDDDGILVGRWAGKPGVSRRSAGRAQGPPAGLIGRALRKKAPQVVPDVDRDADFHRDVPATRSEMVVPLIESSEAIGALDFQSEQPAAFDLDDVVSAEVLAEFLVVAFRNARLHASARRN
jgi:putative methionine-R-sulfoxide reductase with GAF domain